MRNLYEYIFALISSVRSGSLKGVILMIRMIKFKNSIIVKQLRVISINTIYF